MFRPLRSASAVCLVLTLAACATPTPYRPADERGAQGYTETRLSDARYRVTFTGNTITERETVQDYALLRAAELTLQQGYDWFQVVARDQDRKQRSYTSGGADFITPSSTTVVQRCGLLTCDTAVATSPGFSTGFGAGVTSTSTAYVSSLEITLGKGTIPKTADAYDARELARTLRERLQTDKQG